MPGIILVIDDDSTLQDLINDILIDKGYSAHLAVDGREALTYLHAADELPDLILLDLYMPGMDGWAFREAQQSLARLAAIPVVLLSAASDLCQNAAALKIPEYLEKPIRAAQLLDVVERYCGQPVRAE
jgi:two-component system chemotaxis response regulator CheY